MSHERRSRIRCGPNRIPARIIAVLDRMDGDADHEDGGDHEPSLAAPENQGSQVTWLRGNDQDREAEIVLSGVPTERCLDPAVVYVEPLQWSGNGNVLAAAAVALLDIVRCR